MSKTQKPLILSISRKRLETQMSSNIERIQSEKLSQTIITRSFNARRNSGQIERYFIESHTTCCISFVVVFSTLILFCIMACLLIIPRSMVKDKIADMTEKIVILTQGEIMRLISADINLSFFYSCVFSSMMEPPEMITPDLYSARDIVKMFAKAYRSNENNKIWRLGLSSGRFIGLSTENGVRLYYSRTNENDIYPLYSWIGDPITYDNSSYPYIFYEIGDIFISYNTQWYILAAEERRTLWTPLSTGTTTNNKLSPIISTASPVIDKKSNDVTAVFSIGVHIEQTQKFFDYILQSPKSRFALINSYDYKSNVVACTGQDVPYEENNNMLSFKTLLELQDDIWRKVISNDKFENSDNFTFLYEGDLIHCVHAAFEMAPGIKWSFFSAFSVKDIVDFDIHMVDEWTVIFFCAFFIIWIIIEVVIVIINHTVTLRQSKILTKKEKKDKDTHIKYVGLSSFIKSFQRLLLSHADDFNINNNVETLINDLVDSPKYTFYDSYQMIKEIEDTKVKNKFVEIFGRPKSKTIKLPRKLTKKDIEIVNYYEEKKQSRNPAFPKQKKEKNTIEQKLEKIISLRHEMLPAKKEKMMKKVAFFVQSFNLLNPLFDPDQLDIIVQKIMLNVDDRALPLLYDSIEFIFILMKRNAQQIIPDTDFSLALNFAIFSYHMSMSNRFDRETALIDKFYQRSQSKISQDAHTILFGLYKILIDTNQARIDRWNNFKNIIFFLITEGAELSQHRNYFDKSKIIIDVAEKTRTKITINEAYSISFFLYCASQFSFYYHTKGNCHALMKLLVPIDLKPRPIYLSKFLSCMVAQYLQPLSNTLGTLCGTDFIEWTRKSVESSSSSPPRNTKVFV